MTPIVILRACPDYDPGRIRRIVREGLAEFGLRPHGRTLVKPNCVASGEFFPHAHTRSEFLEGVCLGLRDRAETTLAELAVGERCGITIPTRFAFQEAHYPEMATRVGNVRLRHFDEETQIPIPLYHDGRLRDVLYTPEPVARADFFVNCPKFKAHPWTTVTFSMKNYIGIQDDRHRLIDHDHKLNAKVADLQYIAQPQFIAIDAITAGEGRMLTPLPYDLGLVIMGNNQVAFDAVCCRIAGVDPLNVEHIRLAHERGFGPIAADAITVTGDVRFEEARERASKFRTGLIRVEDYFAGTHIKAYAGPPPSDTDNYCWGGCPGAMEEAIEILRLFDKATDTKMPPVHIVFGHYTGPIDAKDGEKVVFIGDCAEYHGEINKRPVKLPSRYIDRSQKDPERAKAEGIYTKMVRVSADMWWNRNEQVIRLKGCPVSVAEQVLALVKLGGLKNPYFHPRQAVGFTSCYLSWRVRTAMHRLFGQPYNGTPVLRGAARPQQNFPPPGTHAPLERHVLPSP